MQRRSVLLPEPLGPADDDHLAAVHPAGDALQHLQAPVALAHVLEEDRRVAGRAGRGHHAGLLRTACGGGRRRSTRMARAPVRRRAEGRLQGGEPFEHQVGAHPDVARSAGRDTPVSTSTVITPARCPAGMSVSSPSPIITVSSGRLPMRSMATQHGGLRLADDLRPGPRLAAWR